MKKGIRIHPVFWIPILLIVFLCGEGLRQLHYRKVGTIAYVNRNSGEIDMHKLHSDICDFLEVGEGKDFYLTVEDTRKLGSKVKYLPAKWTSFNIINSKEDGVRHTFSVQEFICEYKENHFYRYTMVFHDDRVEISRIVPKLVRRQGNKGIFKYDSDEIQKEVPSGEMLFDFIDRAQSIIEEGDRGEEEEYAIRITNTSIPTKLWDEETVAYIISEDGMERTEIKNLQEGIYIHGKIYNSEKPSQHFFRPY